MNYNGIPHVDGRIYALLAMESQPYDLVGPEWHSSVLTDPSFCFRGTVVSSPGAESDKGFADPF